MESFEAVILCGGLGSRLASVLPDRQKCVAEVGGRPFLEYILQQLVESGCRKAVLCVGHHAESVESIFSGQDFGLELVLSKEEFPLGTGGAIRQALGCVRADAELVVAMNGDSICPVDLRELIAFHRGREADLTVVLCEADGRMDAGNVALDAEGRITHFGEKSGKPTSFLNAGVYCFNPAALHRFPKGKRSMEKEIIPELISDMRVWGFETRLPLLDIGTPDRYQQAAATLEQMLSQQAQ